MERRLVSILQTAIESSVSLEQAISCFEVFSEVLNENLLKGLALKSFQGFNQQFKQKLETVVKEFQQQKSRPTLEPNMPEMSGQVFWARVQINRVRIPFMKLEALHNAYLAKEQDELYDQNKLRYSQFVSMVNQYEKEKYEMWSGNVNEKCVKKLEEFLLKRTEIEIIGLEKRSKLESEGKLDEKGCYMVE